MNLNIGVLGFLTFTAYLLICGFFLRSFAARYPDNAFSKALGFIY